MKINICSFIEFFLFSLNIVIYSFHFLLQLLVDHGENQF